MTKIELARLAGALAIIRPDWPADSLATFLGQFVHRPLRDVAVAMAWVATDPDTRSPGRVLEPGPWWSAARTADVPRVANDCPTHPLAELRGDPVTGRTCCAGCHADRRADESATAAFVRQPVPDAVRRRMATPDTATPTRKATG